MNATPHPLTSAQAKLVDDNIRLAHWVAWKYLRRYPALSGFEEDLRSDAVLALCGAAQAFDPTRGFQFSTYATYLILADVQRAVNSYLTPASGRKSRGVRAAGKAPLGVGVSLTTSGAVTAPALDDDAEYYPTALCADADADVRADAKHVWATAKAEIALRIPTRRPRGRNSGARKTSDWEAKVSGGSTDPERDADLFLRLEFGEEEGKAMAKAEGVSRQRIYDLAERGRRAFHEWAADLQAEEAA